MKHTNSKHNISIMNTLIILFSVVLIITVSGLGTLVFSGWLTSAKQMIYMLTDDMNLSIYNKVDSLMSTPTKINEVNHRIIENKILNMSDETARERFFVSVLSSYSNEIYSFSYGTATGEYYGARRNKSGDIEIMKNNAATGGNTWYYSVANDMTAEEIVLKSQAFDPRSRDWYKAAEQSSGPSFSPIYKHFVMDDLTVSASYPVYDNGNLIGVLGTHMLLSNIGSYLHEIVSENQGYAFILEKDTGFLIGNSIGEENFTVLSDGTLKRNSLSGIEDLEVNKAFQRYQNEHEPNFLYNGEQNNLYYHFKEYHQEGIDWIIVTAVPEELFTSEVNEKIKLTIILTLTAVLLSWIIYIWMTRRLFKPMSELLRVSDRIASGLFSDRVTIYRKDEIGKISIAFNKVADHLQESIIHLEETVKIRTSELEDNKDQLQLVLNSTAEAIYGINLEGICTFCNRSCYEILGYASQWDILGKDTHNLFHHSHSDGSLYPVEDCKIIQSVIYDSVIHSDVEVFWRADGTALDVEYYAHPQKKDGKVIGAVITFMDISERKKADIEIKYHNCHDVLTGVYNRSCFEENLKRLDSSEHLPLSIIFADINKLKMTNDIFGHAKGDELIKTSAEILKQSCRNHDVIARTGGDEFIILMPRTNQEEVEGFLENIRAAFDRTVVASIRCSVSLGSSTKFSHEQSIDDVIIEAEDIMYKNKVLARKSTHSEVLDTIIETFHTRSPREKQHAVNVSELCGEIGAALKLSDSEIKKVKRAGYLHDIGKIVMDDQALEKQKLEGVEREKMLQHVVMGYRILNLFDDTVEVSDIVYSHHERWDGLGYPRGLKGEEIPILSRIIAIAERYDRFLGQDGDSNIHAVNAILEGSGNRFDPKIVGVFLNLLEKR